MRQPISYTLHSIPSGPQGVRVTLRTMADIVRKYKKNPTIRELALYLTQNLPPKKWLAEVRAIHNFVRDNIRYVKDIRGCETLQTPDQTLRLGAGDCDDKNILAASLLMAIGHPVKIVAVGMSPGTFQHVLPFTKIGGKWVGLETTEPWPLGKVPRNVQSKMVEHV